MSKEKSWLGGYHKKWCSFLHFFEVIFGGQWHKKEYGNYGGKCERCGLDIKELRIKL